jgi:hypothetical protein
MKKEKRERTVNTVVEDGEPRGDLPVFTSAAPVESDKPEEKAPEKVEEPSTRTGLLKITAKQYVQARGIRWERAAGFLHWATSKHGARHLLTVPEWTKVHEGFNRTPVGR